MQYATSATDANERVVEIIGTYVQGEGVNYEPHEVGSYLDLLIEIREHQRKHRRHVLEREAPELAKQVERWLENPGLYRLMRKRRSHQGYLNTEAPEVDWVVESVLESNGTVMFYGASGIGKTFFGIHMAACIGSGSEWFGKETRQSKVLYLDGENGEDLMHRRAQLVGYDEADVEYISFPQIDLDDEGLKMLKLVIRECGAEVVIIDPLVNAMQGDENTVEDVRPQIKGLRSLSESEGVAIVVLHHENRSGGYRGSSVFQDLVTLQARLREDEEKTSEDVHYAWVAPQKQRQSNLHQFPFIWFIEDGEYRAGLLHESERTFKEVEALVTACRDLKEQNGEWPGKTQLVRAKDLHGLSRRDAKDALDQTLGDELQLKVGKHNKQVIYVL